ncbi:SpoIIE family protein phosphatase [Micromonospora rosaria]|uniref:SpoIIE family protein phosphatase n=1 Tax=Micromonospora rosaria TaxID=47874 RepID=UPI00147261F0|nr:SpoIIE family protein phosphatase [Micromonospora rosaria]
MRVQGVAVGAGDANEPARVAAVRATGLDAVPDAVLDRFVGLVARVLAVPVALVSLVDDVRQFFPGAVGLAAPWQQGRTTPLTHSFCQRVVRTGQPLVVSDARTDARVCDSPAIEDLRVVAYAGMPLTDETGHVLGSLCAIDDRPREWSDPELALLTELASTCSVLLGARVASARAEEARTGQRQAQAVARTFSARVNAALRRSQLLLAASQDFTRTVTVPDVIAAVQHLVVGEFTAVHVSVALRDDNGGVTVFGAEGLPAAVSAWARFPADAPGPLADVLRERRLLFCTDRAELLAAYPTLRDTAEAAGWQALVVAPLFGFAGIIGTLNIAWEQPRPADVEEQAVIVSVAGYVSQAMQRARHLTDRVQAAATLQRAMLTPLPTVERLEITTRYQPAQSLDQVGGDWYDVVVTGAGALSLVIGDVTGHDLHAAAQMSQLRSMLRGYLIDRHEPPSALLRRLDQANFALGARTIATALVAHLTHGDGEPVTVSWSNAGHPAPLVVAPDGGVHPLTGRDPLLGVTRLTHRTTRSTVLPPGATLLLHTDGLLERRDRSPDEMTVRLRRVLAGHATAPLDDLVDGVLAAVPATDHEDDVALLALRVPDEG